MANGNVVAFDDVVAARVSYVEGEFQRMGLCPHGNCEGECDEGFCLGGATEETADDDVGFQPMR